MNIHEDLLNHALLTDDEREFLENEIKTFKKFGIGSSQETQLRLKEISAQLSDLALKFDDNCMNSTEQWLKVLSEEQASQLPASIQRSLAENFEKSSKKTHELTKGYAVSLADGHYQDVMMYSPDRALRKALYDARVTQCGPQDQASSEYNNSAIMKEILQLRKEKAHLLGFRSYNHLQLSDRFAQDPKEIDALYEKILPKMLTYWKSEMSLLTDFAKEDGVESLQPWDIAYYVEKYNSQKNQLDHEEFRQYFPLHNVQKVMLETFGELLQLSFKTIPQPENAWHPDVFALDVYCSNSGEHLGVIYCDLFARNDKQQGAWMLGYQAAYQKEGIWEKGVAFLCANFRKSETAGLTLYDMETLFHEFGHSLNHLLSRRTLRSVSGIEDVPMDIIELPSQLFECWCTKPEILDRISAGLLPADKRAALIASKKQFQALFCLRQILIGLFDWQAHAHEENDLQKIWESITQDLNLGVFATSYNFNTLQHIFSANYDAGYYSYLFALLYVAQCDEKLQSFDSPVEGMTSFRKNFLELGGAADLKSRLEEQFLQSGQKIEPFFRSIGYELMPKTCRPLTFSDTESQEFDQKQSKKLKSD